MHITQKVFLAGVIALFPLLAFGHNHDQPGVEIESIQVADRIYMLTGQGGNIGLALDDEYTLMIDDQFANLSDAIKAKIATLSDKPIAYLLNTHFHYDHTGGNENFSDAVGVIVAHENVRTRLAHGTIIKAFGKQTEAYPESALPALTFNDQLTIHQAGEEIQLIHFAGAHTDGDAVVLFKTSNVIHTGDLYFSGFYPFIDTSNGGSVHGYIKAMEGLLELADDETKIIPGHGPLSTKKDLSRDAAVLKKIVQTVEAALAKGMVKEGILNLEVIKAFDASHGKGLLPTENFLEIIIDGLR
jgi:glyoxylase-like metal-dependent hydrolase (beta-lactamase superfamily II)